MLRDEQAVIKNLQTNEQGFKRSQGDEWYQTMHDDALRLATLRGSLVQLNERLQNRTRHFLEEGPSLAATIPIRIEVPTVARVAFPKLNAGELRIDAGELRDTPTSATSLPAEAAAPGTMIVETPAASAPPQVKRQRPAMNWIKLGMLELLLSVSVGCLLSIVVPLQRGLRAPMWLRRAPARLVPALARLGSAQLRLIRALVWRIPTPAQQIDAPMPRLLRASAWLTRSLVRVRRRGTKQLEPLALAPVSWRLSLRPARTPPAMTAKG